MNIPAAAQSSNRYDGLMRRKSAPTGSDSAPENAVRLQRQFEIIFSGNREAFQGARVLDLMSASGFWSSRRPWTRAPATLLRWNRQSG